MLRWPIFVKFAWRDLRNGEFTLLCLSLFLAVTCMSAMQQFSELVRAEGRRHASNFLGADAVVTRNGPIPAAWKKTAQALQLKQTTTLHFLSMAVHDKKFHLVQVKAVDEFYPLRGQLTINTPQQGDLSGVHAPESDTTWVNPRLLSALNLRMGESLKIGETAFHVAGVIVDGPGQRGDWLSISPQILIQMKDVIKTQALQLGSKVTYNWLLAGPKAQLNQLKHFLQAQLGDHLQWSDNEKGTPAIDALSEKTLHYLNLGVLLSLLLGGVAISMASLRYCQRQLQQVALLRCFGATQGKIIGLYFSALLSVGLLCTGLGILFGWALQPFLIQWLGGMLHSSRHIFSYFPLLFSFLMGMLLLIGFSGGPFWQLRRVHPGSLFARQHQVWIEQLWPTYLFTFILLIGLGYFYTQSWIVTALIFFSVLFFIGLVYLSFKLEAWLTTKYVARLPLSWRFGFKNLSRNQTNSGIQVVTLGLALTIILTLTLFKNNMLDAWRQELPPQTPNYFLINIAPEQVTALTHFLLKKDIAPTAFYPMVRGRLVKINGKNVQTLFGERAKEINALQRDLNFSWSTSLPEGNTLAAGKWISKKINWVSVEEGLAKQLGLKIGDTIGIDIGEEQRHAEVVNLRKVDWQSFKPNFFMLFKPGLLDDLPTTFITSFYLPANRVSDLTKLAETFPNVTLIDVASILNKVREMIDQIGQAMNFMVIFCLLIALLIGGLSLLSFNATKQQETRLLKVLGMRRRALLWVRSSEALILGLYTGVLAGGVAIGICYGLATYLNMPFVFPWQVLLYVPILIATLNLVINWFIQHKQYEM